MKRLFEVLICLITLTPVLSETIHVPTESNPDIQSAIGNAQNGDVIIVAKGNYQENIDFLGKAVTLRSTDPNDPNIIANTIIDANNPQDPNFASAVIFRNGESNQAVLEGFTIKNGTGSWIPVSWKFKGLRWNRCGGGVLCYNMSQPTIRKNIFINNSAGQGGGIYVYGNPVNPDNPSNPPEHLSPIITDNTFINNQAIIEHGFDPPDNNYPCNDHGDGGAVVAFQGVDPIIKNNLIQDNTADAYGGGLHIRQWSNGTIQNNQVIHNRSGIGSGIHITYFSSPEVIENLIKSNYTGAGSALYVYYYSEPKILRNFITLNSSGNQIIGVHYNSAGVIKNNIIYKNENSPAILCTSSSPLISHNTIIGNEVCGIQCNGTAEPVIENNIISSTVSGCGLNAGNDANPTIKYNNVWNNELGNYGSGLTDLTGTQGNISIDPDFINESNSTGKLTYNSPCIDAGDPNFTSEPNETDYCGNPRILKAQTDIGAYEVPPVWNITSKKQYLTIQSAINDANNYDTIIAVRDTYYENLNINGRSIYLRSILPNDSNCIENTIIEANETNLPVITFAGSEDSNCTLTGFTITGANNAVSGGAITGNGTRATISFCSITDNTAYEGAGIYNCDGLIANCKISNNTSRLSGAGLNHCDGQIYNCFVTKNYAQISGGGLYDCYADIINNTIAENSADISAGGLHSCPGKISNCIIWANAAPQHPAIYQSSQPTYSCLQTQISGTGNIFCDPGFIDPNNNYHLTPYSNCIDTADNNALPTQFAKDIDNETRPHTFDPNKQQLLDIGADEVLTSIADFNQDGLVNCFDFNDLLDDWLETLTGSPADLKPDGFIDFDDYALFAKDWGFNAPWAAQQKNSALLFNSDANGYVKIHTPEGCILNNVFTFTYTAWIYPIKLEQMNARIIGKNERAMLIRPGGVLAAYSTGGGIPNSVSEPGTIQTGKWNFIAMTYDYYNGDKRIDLFVNAKEVEYQTHYVGAVNRPPLPDWLDEGQWDLHIGTAAWSQGNYIPDTVIDEIAFYDKVLTIQQLEYLYNHSYGRPTGQLNPIGLWHLDENSADTLLDSSGNQNHGILHGNPMPIWQDGKFLKY